MSLFSTLDSSKLTADVRQNLEPLLQKVMDSAASDEDKALAQLHVESVAWQTVVSAQLTELRGELTRFNDSFAKIVDSYDLSSGAVTLTISKEKK